MRRLLSLIAVLVLLAYAVPSEAQVNDRRWLVQTSDGKLLGFTDDQDVDPPDAAFATFVLESVIRGADPPGATGDILPLGTWDGTVYTAPSGGGIVVPIDPTTDQGSVQEAAHDMMDVFDVALEFILENRLAWPDTHIEKTTEAIYWMQVNAARVALNATRTAANRVKFLEEAASWPVGLNGAVEQLADYLNDGISLPTKDWSWVDPEADPPSRITLSMTWEIGFMSATNVETQPTSADLIGRGWIANVP